MVKRDILMQIYQELRVIHTEYVEIKRLLVESGKEPLCVVRDGLIKNMVILLVLAEGLFLSL